MEENDKYSDVIISAAEFIKDRLYFVTLNTDEKPKSTQCTHYFNIDWEFCYESFFTDFGPLNLSMLYHYCTKVNKKLKSSVLQNKRIVHYTTYDKQKRVNSAYLIASYAILYLNYTPEHAYSVLQANSTQDFIEFRDASAGSPYTISLLDCLKAIHKAHSLGFFNFDSFDFIEYEHFERVENGDLNWILPNKFIGFCGPHNKSKLEKGYPLHSPETYFGYFRLHGVTTIIRLNKKLYDSNTFVNAGFDHKDLYFVDGSTPSDRIMNQFINICEKASGAIAVHCKAGLGRTGSLIGCYIMKHYQFTAHEAIAWIRICRPGSIIGHQQNWLESKEAQMWRDGELYRRKMGIDSPIKHTQGIYSLKRSDKNKKLVAAHKDNVSGILQKVDTMKLNDKEEKFDDKNMTQGDKLNQIKAQRNKSKTLLNSVNGERRAFRTRVLVSPLEFSGVLRTTKVTSAIKTPGTAAPKRVTKRNGCDHLQVGILPKRCSQRIVNNPSALSANGNLKLPAQLAETEDKNSNTAQKKEDSRTCANEIIINNAADLKTSKRGKRSLNLEKEKPSVRSIKVLRRSHPQTLPELAASKSGNLVNSKFQLPVVKLARHNV